jgi:hypothetical protein
MKKTIDPMSQKAEAKPESAESRRAGCLVGMMEDHGEGGGAPQPVDGGKPVAWTRHFLLPAQSEDPGR